MEDYKNRIEAILFTTGRFMDVEEIARLCGIGSIGIVKDAIDELKKDYEIKGNALALINEDNKFKLGIKKEYNYLTTNLMSDAELDEPATKTLALIAYKQPVLQSDIIGMRGNTAYDHIKALRDAGFVFAEKKGRTRLLKLAPKFFDYFDVVENEVKSKIVSNEVAKIEQETKTIEDSLKTAEKNNAEGSDAEEDEDLNVKKEKKGEDHETKIT
ncbi:SMC-Scp complex subunit ScpB [Candidatus Woesearchaeota archaeon]|nr:SMC-Scp complex subunit ScpB [Candidatus Woesearchaeota archaeon]